MSLLLVSPCTARLGWWDAGTNVKSNLPLVLEAFPFLSSLAQSLPLSCLIVRKFEEEPPTRTNGALNNTALKLDRPWSPQ